MLGVLLGFVTGWSHEGYAIPLSGAIFLYSAFNFRHINRRMWLVTAALWAGTLLLIMSPANFQRVGSLPWAVKLLNGLLMYGKLRLFWLAVAIILIARCIDKAKWTERVRRYSIVWMAWGIGTLFCLYAHTGPWGLMGNEFFAFLAMLSMLPIIFSRVRMSVRTVNAIACVLLAAMFVHQDILISTMERQYYRHMEFSSAYVYTKTGLVFNPDCHIPAVVRPWVYRWYENDSRGVKVLSSLRTEYNLPDTHPKVIVIGSKTHAAIHNPGELFTAANKVAGDSPFYYGDRGYWAYADSIRPGENFTFHFAPVKPSECPYALLTVKALFAPGSFDETAPADTAGLRRIHTKHADLIYLPDDQWRTVDAIYTNPK